MGEVPRTHSVRELLGIVAESSPELRAKVRAFARSNRERLRLLDDAYISARYLPSRYGREDAEALVGTGKEIERLLRRAGK